MRNSIRIARIVQLAGVLLLFKACTELGVSESAWRGYLGGGLVVILGARIFEWLTKE